MPTAKKLKSGSWRVQAFSHFEYKGDKKVPKYRSFTAPTKAAAEMAAAKFANDKKRFKVADLTVGEAVMEYIKKKEPVLSPATIKGYYVTLRNLGEISKVKISALSSDDLQKWVNSLTTSLSPKSIRNRYALIMAVVSGYSERHYHATMPARPPLVYDVPTDDQVKLLIREAEGDLKLAILLSAVGTLRRGEACALKYKDVYRDQSAVFVHADLILNNNKEWIYKDIPKTASSVRMVPLPAEIMALIPEGDPEAFIISCSPDAITKRFFRLRRRFGLSCRFHDLRHYAVSILHAIGLPDQYLMERGGWRTPNTLRNVYRNTLSDRSKEYADKANGYFSNNLL
jgi:integrase